MKKHAAAVLILLLAFSSVTFAQKPEELISSCKKILADLETLVQSKDKKRNDAVYAAITLGLDKIKEGSLEIQINEDIPRDIYMGIQFQYSPVDASILPSVHISPYVLGIYEKNPSIVFSAITHEFMHAKSYFDNKKYFMAMGHVDLERYLYELDAYNIEANFIKTYLAGGKYSLTSFEQLLVKSFDNDYLANFSFGMLGHDMNLTFTMLDIRNRKATYEDKIAKISDLIDSYIQKKYSDEGDEFAKYMQTVPVNTVLKFAPQIIRDIESEHGKIKDQKNYHMKNQNPALYEKLLKLESVFLPLMKYYKYKEQITERFKTVL